ncbi:MAG: SDR family oxidoreductase [Dehalococcoidia bacterium]|nr:SDR family oxidoreductase [Dehalococcoidia bacterium]
MRLKGKVAFIAGAGDNMGRAIPVLFAQEGACVMLVTRNQANLDETARQTRAAAGAEADQRVATALLDLKDQAAVLAAIAECVRRFGGLDIVANVAGGYSGAHPELTAADPAFFTEAMPNLLQTLINVTDAAWPHLQARGSGSVINVGAAPLTRLVGTPAYHGAKLGMIGISQSLAWRGAPDNIRVNNISPGRMRLPLPQPPYSADTLPKLGTLATRYGSGVDVAYAALYFAGDESAWVTGADLVVDGGDAAMSQFPDKKLP